MMKVRESDDMTWIKNGWIRVSVVALVLFNIGLFLKINTIPVLWQQGELTYHYLFWTAQGNNGDVSHLRSGLHADDFLKVFALDQLDYQFRPRHFSYLLQMFSAKLWQSLEVVTFRDYTLIGLHLLNVLLVFFCLKRLTRDAWVALAGSMLALNSGTAHATLLFPSIYAKILTITLILLCWLCVLSFAGKFLESGGWRKWLAFFLILLALFTDESVVFLMMIIIGYIFLTERVTIGNALRFLLQGVLVISVFLFLSKLFLYAEVLLNGQVIGPAVGTYLHRLFAYYQNSAVLSDTGYALTAFFLRRNLGYWDSSGWGIAAVVAACALFVLIVRGKPGVLAQRIAGLIVAVIFLKAILLPHPYAVNPAFMPPGTTFPCLLFFGYYYPYAEAILLAMALGILLKTTVVAGRSRVLIALVSITLINCSHGTHVREGIAAPVAYHGFYLSHQNAIPQILSISKKLPYVKNGPIYLSFPSGSQPFFNRKCSGENIWEMDPAGERQQLSPEFMNYASIIPVKYLRPIEQGELLMSLRNVRRPGSLADGHELLAARYFYDVPKERFVDLAAARKEHGPNSWAPVAISAEYTKVLAVEPQAFSRKMLFFVKGGAKIALDAGEQVLRLRQRYGYAYEMFILDLGAVPQNVSNLTLTIAPAVPGENVQLVGPVFLDQE